MKSGLLLCFSSSLALRNLSYFADTDKNRSENAAVLCFIGHGIPVIHPNLISVLASYVLLLALSSNVALNKSVMSSVWLYQ